jgi:hypothetical protein
LITENEEYMDMAQRIQDPGISIFKFLRPGSSAHNCELYFAEKGGSLWDIITGPIPDHFKIDMLSKYDPEKMFLVCVFIEEEDNVSNIGMFERGTNREIM